MKKPLQIFLALATMFAIPAFAADPAQPEISMTVQQAMNLNAALGTLNGYTATVEESGKEKQVQKYYTFSAATILAIAKDADMISTALKPSNEARVRIIKESGQTDLKSGSKEEAELLEKLRPILDEELKLRLYRLKLADLNLDKNPISPGIVQILLPILEDK